MHALIPVRHSLPILNGPEEMLTDIPNSIVVFVVKVKRCVFWSSVLILLRSLYHVTGWPLWFVPVTGYRAYQARPNSLINTWNVSSSPLSCNDTYRGVNPCTMKCKSLPGGQTVTSLATITSPFNETSCTLMSNISWTIEIPMDHYLVFFTNWTTTNFTLLCTDPSYVGSSPPSMLCRYEVDQLPFVNWQCPSTPVTSRFIAQGELQ